VQGNTLASKIIHAEEPSDVHLIEGTASVAQEAKVLREPYGQG
jgi:hypothetical protein